MKTWHVPLALLLVGGAVFVYTAQERRHRAEMEQLHRETKALAATMEENQAHPSTRISVLPWSERPGAAPPADPAPPAAEKRASPTPESAPPPRGLESAEVTTQLDAAFAQERRDRDWSPQSQKVLTEKAGPLMPKGSAIVSVDCRASLCRVEMNHQSVDDYRAFTESAYLNGATHIWNGPMFSTLIGDPSSGPVVAVSYLAREGQSFPVSFPTAEGEPASAVE